MRTLDLGKVVPEKGIDYFTEAEINEIVEDVAETVIVPEKTSDLTNDSGFIDNTVNNLANYELKTNTGSVIELSINSDYVMTLNLKNSAGTTISTQNIDLPLETMVVGASYSNVTKNITLTLQNGTTTSFSVADLVSGLQTEITLTNKLSSDLVDDTTSTNKFVTSQEKTNWNNKSDFSGDYDDLTNKPTIPSALSDLTDDTTHRLVTDTEKTAWNNKQDVMQFSTMPNASADTVGKIVQYIGTTNANYTNGYFYIGTTDGTNYSWSNINVQAGSSDSDKLPIYDFLSSTQIGTISQFGTTLSADDKTMLAQIINEAYLKGHHSLGINFSFNENYGSSILFTNIDGNVLLQKKPTGFDLYSVISRNLSNTSINAIDSYMLRINMTWNDDVATVSNAKIFKSTSRFLTTTNESTYTPTSDYNPATKKYVDDKLTTYSGYDATKTQTLKNVNGTLTWVDD